MKKQNVVYPYSGISFGHEKEWSSDTWYNVDQPWKHVRWKKLGTKEHILYDPIYMKFQNR